MKIVVLDGYTENPNDLSWDEIGALGDLTVYDRTKIDDQDEIIHRIGDAELVLTNKTPVGREVIDACPSMRYIGVLATGYNVVDVAYAKEKGIPVTNIPAYGTDAVAQFAIALLLEICHRIGHHDGAVKAGRWAGCADFCFWDYPLIELAGKTMGIIGYGRIGRRVAEIANALGMRILVNNGHPVREPAGFVEDVPLGQLFAESDVISLHCPLFDSTKGIISKDSIAQMKDGVIIINNSRGALIVEQDLADALNAGKVQAAAVDVVSEEPIKETNPLLTAENCLITPHISWAPLEARRRIMEMTARNLRNFLDGSPTNVVNG